MKKFIKTAALTFACSFLPISAHSAAMLNGDFQSGDFSGWSVDSDGLGDPLSSSDFSIVNNTAQIQADYSNNQLDFVNTLYQELNFTNSTGKFMLSFEWTLTGDAPFSDEIFGVGLVPTGTVDYYDSTSTGFLFEQTGYGSGIFTAILDSSFLNQEGGWMLEFQMLRGFDGLGSTLQIDNVSLQAQTVQAVPEPSEMLLLGVGLVALYMVRRKAVVV